MSLLFCNAKKVFFLMVACCIFIDGSVSSCQGAEAQRKNVVDDVQQLAVMPFLEGSTEAQKREKNLEKNLDCQLQGLCSIEDEPSRGEETVASLVQSELRRKFGDKIMPQARVISDYKAIKKDPTDTPREIAVRLGKSLGVDHVLVGLVWRYRDRVGSALGTSESASVAFSLFIVNVGTQKLVWKNSFDKTQTALTDNLFDAPMFFQKGMRWLTAEELSSYGVKKVFEQLSIK